MRYAACIFVALCLCGISDDEIVYAGWPVIAEEIVFIRGDVTGDLQRNINDVTYLSNYLFSGGPPPGCMESADCNNDDTIGVSDVSYLSNWLFNGGPSLPDPNVCENHWEEDMFSCDDTPCE